jgi:hypothetical protein
MAKYLVLIYGDEQQWDAETPEVQEAKGSAHAAFVARAAGGVTEGGALGPTTAAKSLRAGSGGRPTITDGPFAEAKEALGGFYVLEAADLDAAVDLAARLPEVSTAHSGVEVRPFWDPS